MKKNLLNIKLFSKMILFGCLSFLVSSSADAQLAASIAQTSSVSCNGGSNGALSVTATGGAVTSGSQTFNYTGSVQSFTVPLGITSLTVDLKGAKGGNNGGNLGGFGGRTQAVISVSPGQVLQFYVGGQGITSTTPGTGGWNGGGNTLKSFGGGQSGTGGGSSDIRISPYTTANRIVIAGGGGGAGYQTYAGAHGGGLIGQDALPFPSFPLSGGKGGTQLAGGAAGNTGLPTYLCTAGIFFQGGTGDGDGAGSGGGGGGYYGGGGGMFCGGGGGSSFTTPGSTSVTHTQGFQNGNGSITISYLASSYSYTWTPNVSSSSTASGLAAGPYSVLVSDGFTSTTATFTIGQPTAISATTTQSNVLCNGGSSAIAALTSTGGTGAYTYSWTPSGGTSATATGLAAGSYSCIIKDANLCALTKTFTITQPTVLTSALASQTNVSCNAGSNGAASVTAAGGTTAYTYAWAPTGGSSASATGLAAGTYTCTITDANSCVSTKTVAITQPAAALAAATTQTNILCFGLNTGAASVATTGGTTAYTYVWAPTGGTSATASALIAGNYTCTITDANACTLVKTFALTQGSAFTISGSATNTVLCNGVSTILNGAGASTYTWTGGVTNGTSFVPTTTTSYSLTGKNASNCPASNTIVVTVTVNPLPLVAVNSGSICNGSSFIMTPTGASTYVYTGGSATVSPTTNTNYTVTGTSALGCTNTAVSNVTVNANPVLTVNSGSLCSGNNFTFTPTGAISYTYSSGSAVVTPTATTTYTVSGLNAFGCASSSVKTITVSITPVINVSSGAVCTGGTWTITPTGAATYTYSSGSAIVTPTAATTDYTVSGSNIDGCQSMAVITITVNPTLLFNPNSGSVCIGSSYTITPTGAVSYTFSSGSAVVTPTANTTYTIVAENSVGCLGTDICTIVVNSLPTVTAATDFTLICLGEVATLTAGGATTYVWNTGATTATTATTPTTTTIYNVNGTDVNGCVNTANVTVNVNDCVGIQQLSSAKLNVSVYPNPTTGLVTLDLNAATQITITNALGQVILTETVLAGKQTIDLKNQNNGLYFMNLQQDGKQQTIKVIKN